MEIIKNYRDDDMLRASFNELAKKTFGINFEDWYQNGYWTDRYNPYSVVADGKVAANVSVNKTDFLWDGKVCHFVQLGTVMTDEAYRNRGFIREIMKEIDKDCLEYADGIYLFANNSVLDFYPRFGFKAAKQYEYTKEISGSGERTVERVPMKDKAAWDKMEQLIRTGNHGCAFDMTGNSELNMFYISKYMKEDVYYHKESDTYVVAETEAGELVINMVISGEEPDLNCLAEAFGGGIHKVKLGFTPKDTAGFSVGELNQDDTVLYIRGAGFEGFEKAKLMFPLLAHA